MKICRTCKFRKPLSGFHKRSIAPDGFEGECKDCKNRRAKRWRDSHPERVRAFNKRNNARRPSGYEKERWPRRRLRRYNLTLERYDEMVEAQDGKCAICRKVPVLTFRIDHDHSCCPGLDSCGECVRGLLCHGCNSALGQLDDDPGTLRRAADYLELYNVNVKADT